MVAIATDVVVVVVIVVVVFEGGSRVGSEFQRCGGEWGSSIHPTHGSRKGCHIIPVCGCEILIRCSHM